MPGAGRVAFVVVLVLMGVGLARAGALSPERKRLYEGLERRFRKAPAPAGPVGTYVVGKMIRGELGRVVGHRGERTWNDDVLHHLRRQGPVALDVLGDVADWLETQLNAAEPGGTAGFKGQMAEAYAAWQADKERIAREAQAVRADEGLTEDERARRLRELARTQETSWEVNSARYAGAREMNERAKAWFAILYGDLAIVTALGGKLFSLQRAAELAELTELPDVPVVSDVPVQDAPPASPTPTAKTPLVGDAILTPTDRLDPNRPVLVTPPPRPVHIHRRR